MALGVAALLSIAAGHTSTLLTGPHPPSADAALTSGYRLSLTIVAVLAAIGGVIAFAALRPRSPARSGSRQARAEESIEP